MLPPSVGQLLTVLIVLVTINAVNFIDGLDGLAAGIVAILLLVLGKIKLGGSMPLGPYLIAGFFGAITVGAWS
jgi:UDP-N-acetylmuramyl pentapeptide phosphotransferase/UDP-N-acetylglucosamine-1-phosphate transferase